MAPEGETLSAPIKKATLMQLRSTVGGENRKLFFILPPFSCLAVLLFYSLLRSILPSSLPTFLSSRPFSLSLRPVIYGLTRM